MEIKGIEKLREKVPILSGKKIFLLPLYALTISSLSILVMIKFDSIPSMAKSSGINPILLSFFPLIGELIVCTVGFVLAFQMWFWKDWLKRKYGQFSYLHIFFVGFAGISCVLSLSINLFIHYWSFSSFFWISSPLKFLIIPPEVYFYASGTLISWAKIALSVFFSGLGITMIIRSLQTFGLDYMAVIYLYFPEESKIQNHKIYSVLRHPAYTGVLLIGLGGMFSTLTLYSVIFYLVFLVGFYIHIHFVEEKELLVRFGPSYQEYMKKVPAFFVKPNKLGVFLGFLLGRSTVKE
jgi:protein-S-isoprenylcysteine O-methyltransferase Ste14